MKAKLDDAYGNRKSNITEMGGYKKNTKQERMRQKLFLHRTTVGAMYKVICIYSMRLLKPSNKVINI